MTSRRPRQIALTLALVASLSWASGPGDAGAPLAAPAAAGLTVMSLNLALGEAVDPIVAGIRAIGGDAADVIVFQEVVERRGQPSVAHQIADRLGLEVVYRPSFALDESRTVGLATLARFPAIDARVLALKRFDLSFRSRDRMALAVTLDAPSGPLHIYNVHLDTRINANDRVAQVAGIIEDLAASSNGALDQAPSRAIIAGDFNTNDNLWLFHMIPLPFLGRHGNGLQRYMASHGLLSAFDRGATHDVLRMRLDWMFLKGMAPTARSIHPLAISDHHALVVSVR